MSATWEILISAITDTVQNQSYLFSVDYEAEDSVNRRSDDYVNAAGWNDFLNSIDKIDSQAQRTKFYLQFLIGSKKPWNQALLN